MSRDISARKTGNRFTIMVPDLDDIERIDLHHACKRKHCSIQCRMQVWVYKRFSSFLIITKKSITESSWFIDPDCKTRGKPVEWPTRGECQEFDSCQNLVMYFRNNRLEDRDFKLGTPITPKYVIKLLDDEIKDTEVTAMKNDLLQELLEVITYRIN